MKLFNASICVLCPVKALSNKIFNASIGFEAYWWQTYSTSQSNQRATLEYGIIIPQGTNQLRKAIPCILEDADNKLSFYFRELFQELYEEIVHFDERIDAVELKLKMIKKNNRNNRSGLEVRS